MGITVVTNPRPQWGLVGVAGTDKPALSLYPAMSSEILGKTIPLYRCP